MGEPVQVERYGLVMQALHWGIALLAFSQLAMGKFAEVEPVETGESYFGIHASLGVLVLGLMALRIFWRLTQKMPAPFPLPGAQHAVMAGMHVAFYVLLVMLPMSGWALASAGGDVVSVFGLFTLPPLPVTPGEANAGQIEEVHELLGNVLLVLAALHVLAALKHHFLDRDTLLRRMSPH